MTPKRKQLPLPGRTTLRGHSPSQGHIWVAAPGKPPKLRFQPGSFIRLRGQLYEIMYCYRVRENPQEWRYSLEERTTLSSQPTDSIGALALALGAGSTTPRIVYEVFRDFWEASSFFSDIPLNSNRWDVDNKTMVQEGEVVSSGEVLDP